jgi:predicted permease
MTVSLALAIVLLVLFTTRLWNAFIGPGRVYPNIRRPLLSSAVPLGLVCLGAFLNLWPRTERYAVVPLALLIVFFFAPQRIRKRWQQGLN